MSKPRVSDEERERIVRTRWLVTDADRVAYNLALDLQDCRLELKFVVDLTNATQCFWEDEEWGKIEQLKLKYGWQ